MNIGTYNAEVASDTLSWRCRDGLGCAAEDPYVSKQIWVHICLYEVTALTWSSSFMWLVWVIMVTPNDIRTHIYPASLLEMAPYAQMVLAEHVHLCSMFTHVRQADPPLTAQTYLW